MALAVRGCAAPRHHARDRCPANLGRKLSKVMMRPAATQLTSRRRVRRRRRPRRRRQRRHRYLANVHTRMLHTHTQASSMLARRRLHANHNTKGRAYPPVLYCNAVYNIGIVYSYMYMLCVCVCTVHKPSASSNV